MSQTVLYDISKDGIYGGIWFFVIWGIFGLTIGLLAWFEKVDGFGKKLKSYLSGAVGFSFFFIAVYFLILGWISRKDCIAELASGQYQMVSGTVTSLEKNGRSRPFRFSFMLEKDTFYFGRALIGACGIAPPPQERFDLTEGQKLTIYFKEERVFKVIEHNQFNSSFHTDPQTGQ
jgi:hypothetical protein